jgi:putative (di)nucleoside polyphosphate hydrolase
VQGGIDPLENPMRAAYRELQEETGITPAHCRMVASIDHWLEYSFPTKVTDPRSGEFLRYRGQTQVGSLGRRVGVR